MNCMIKKNNADSWNYITQYHHSKDPSLHHLRLIHRTIQKHYNATIIPHILIKSQHSAIKRGCHSFERVRLDRSVLSEGSVGEHQPADVHWGHSLPGVGFRVEPLHRVEAAGAIIASCYIQHAIQHGHPGTAAPTQHVGNGCPSVALLIKTT